MESLYNIKLFFVPLQQQKKIESIAELSDDFIFFCAIPLVRIFLSQSHKTHTQRHFAIISYFIVRRTQRDKVQKNRGKKENIFSVSFQCRSTVGEVWEVEKLRWQSLLLCSKCIAWHVHAQAHALAQCDTIECPLPTINGAVSVCELVGGNSWTAIASKWDSIRRHCTLCEHWNRAVYSGWATGVIKKRIPIHFPCVTRECGNANDETDKY